MKLTLGLLSALTIGAASALGAAGAAHADEQYRSLLLQNDFFLGHDGGGYTNGLSFSSIRAVGPGETEVESPSLLKSIAPLLGLPSATLGASSLSQLIVTPRDISRVDPDPNDAPYAGALVFRSAQVYVHGNTAELLAVNLGVIGPASGAEQTQRFIHRLLGSTRPRGWDSQIGNKPMLGLERYRAWRFPFAERTANGGASRASGDFIAVGGGTLSNLESSAGFSLLLRYGEGLDKSFPAATRLGGRTSDPVLLGNGWSAFASFSADRLFNHVGVGSDWYDGASRLRELRLVGAAGFAYGWSNRASLGFAVQAANPVVKTSSRVQSYGSITYTYRID